MLITNQNKKLLEEIYFHDAKIDKIIWDMNAAQINMLLANHFTKKKIEMVFKGVLYAEAVNLNLHSERYEVNDFAIPEDSHLRAKLKKRVLELQPDYFSPQPTDDIEEDMNQAVIGRFFFSTLDFMHIACSGIEVEVTEL